MKTTVTHFALLAGTHHHGAVLDGAPRPICGTTSTAAAFAPLADDAPLGRVCTTCERGLVVLLSRLVRPEFLLLAGVKAAAADHHAIPGDNARRAYCGRQLGDGAPAGGKVCKDCTGLRDRVTACTLAFDEECPASDGHVCEPCRCCACPACGYTGQFQEEAGVEEDFDAAVEATVDEWIGATPGQQLTLMGMRPDAQQGALFA